MEGNTQSKFKSICVFCGCNAGNRKVFSDAALELGDELVKRRIDLVYGGGSIGLMGLISQTVFDGGCHVLGVIPTALMPLEISGQSVGEVKIVTDMHERKAEMARQADAFIALPGGYGTMEETLEMITWSQLGIHNKPVGLLNVDGYYNSLLALFDKGVQEGFIKPAAQHIVVSAPTAKELLARMEQYIPTHENVVPHNSWQMERLGGSPMAIVTQELAFIIIIIAQYVSPFTANHLVCGHSPLPICRRWGLSSPSSMLNHKIDVTALGMHGIEWSLRDSDVQSLLQEGVRYTSPCCRLFIYSICVYSF
ncbi:hypothetical protein NE237_027092 [Protea cynaroides]|uniref:cytokinin riboside 5'-monophosphate phosphoribohydrolase n=1 Tax=Protea cynaroides TaxID=273540 RepID=A0A9Q0GPU1_9MAGN|nr:hypothetical protein NE237_027092 [Protea cynaroides]